MSIERFASKIFKIAKRPQNALNPVNDYPNQVFLNGKFESVPESRPTPLTNPATEEVWIEVQAATTQTLDRAVEGSQSAFRKSWRDLKPGKRAELLYKVAALIRKHQERIAMAESLNIGKPISDAMDEAGLGARVFEYYAGAISHFGGQTIPVASGGLDYTLRQPLGVIAAVTPWNFPFPIACWKVAPALAAGNCVILKPATLSPVTALILAEILQEAGLPEGVIQVLPGSGSTLGPALTQDVRIRKISFTGSTEVGKEIMRMASTHLQRISLELGGKSPNIVFADADLALAASKSPMSVFANTGQDCCARSRIFVEASIYEEFVDRFVEATSQLVVGDPLDPKTQIGPMVSSGQRQSVEEFIQNAKELGRSIRIGGARPIAKGFYISPTVITDVDYQDRCWREEIFGPVVCVTPFNNEEDVMNEVNNTAYGLSGSVWTRDLHRALRVSRGIESGVISVNTHSSVHVEAPFGGFKASGIGRDLGMNAMEGYTELKNIYIPEQ